MNSTPSVHVSDTFAEPARSGLSTDLQQLRDFSKTLNLSESIELIDEVLQSTETDSSQVTPSSVLVNRIIASGTEILSVIHIKQNAGQMQQTQFHQAYQTSIAEIESLKLQKTEQLKNIDDAIERVKIQAQPLVTQLEQQLTQIPAQVIDSCQIQITDLKKTKVLSERLARQISDEIQKASQQMSAQLQREIERELISEAKQVEAFSNSVVQTMQHIEMKFLQKDKNLKTLKKGIALTTAVVTKQGGIWSGYQVAGIKGAAVGIATATVSTTMSTHLVTSLIGFSAALPAFIAITVLSSLTGNWFLNKIFANERIRQFKKEYQKQIQAAVKKQLNSTSLSKQVNEHIHNSFAVLKQQLHQQVEALLQDTQQTLEELQSQRSSDSRLRVDLDNIRVETQQILNRLSQS
jgi:hypothetical protein